MNIVLNKLSLDVNKSGTQANIVAKQGDIQSRAVIITFNKNGQIYNVEEGNTAIIRAKKPDGTVIYNSATVEDGKVYFIFTSQYCTSVGKVTLEVQILDSNNHVLYTPKFILRVEDNLYDDNEIESTNEYTQLTQSINQAQAAITTAQSLSLIKYVSSLPTTGDSKYLYILYNTEDIYSTDGLPSQFKTEAEYNGWKTYYGENAKACMFKTTSNEYPYVFFNGIELEIETYSNPGMYTLKGIMSNYQPVEYLYNASTKQWEAYAPLTGVNVGDNIIKGESYIGSETAWEESIVIDDDFEADYAKLYGFMWCIGEFTMINRLNTVTYTEEDDPFAIYDSFEVIVPYGVPYVYDSSFNQFIEVTDADLKNRVAIIENIIEDIDYDIDSLETGKQDKLTAGSNISINSSNVISATDTTYTAGKDINIENNIITALVETFNVCYTYSAYTNAWTCEQSANDIQTALEDGKKLLIFLKYINVNGILIWENTLGASGYILSSGPNNMYAIQIYLNMFGGDNNDTKFEFRFAHILGQNVISGYLYTQEYQRKLTAGSNITIDSNNVISASGGGSQYTAGNGIDITNNVISSDILVVTYTYNFTTTDCTCDTSYADIVVAYNAGKTIIPILKQDNVDFIAYPGNFTYIDNSFNPEFVITSITGSQGIQSNRISVYHIYDEEEEEDVVNAGSFKGYGEKYTAGDGISISNGVISVSYDDGDSEVY